MGFKKTDQCLAKVADDEPIFVLRAKDLLAPQVVRFWASLVEEHVTKFSPERTAKAKDARDIARLMEDWQSSNLASLPD